MRNEELQAVSYEISVLGLPVRVKSADEIEMGKHGVILRWLGRSGVFLPKVAEDLAWDKNTFLSELCSQKAGLPRDCWMNPSAELSVFTAEEFKE